MSEDKTVLVGRRTDGNHFQFYVDGELMRVARRYAVNKPFTVKALLNEEWVELGESATPVEAQDIILDGIKRAS